MDSMTCPLLGLSSEDESHFDYPSTRNRCWRTGSPGDINIDHQEAYCLTTNYHLCPIFTQDVTVAEEKPQTRSISLKFIFGSALGVVSVGFIVLMILLLIKPNLFPSPIGDYFEGLFTSNTENVNLPSGTMTVETVVIQSTADKETAKILGEFADSTVPVDQEIDQLISTPSPTIEVIELNLEELDQESPSSYKISIDDEGTVRLEPVYILPAESSSLITIEDQTIELSEYDTRSFIQRGTGFTVEIGNVLNESGRSESIWISSNGRKIDYETEVTKAISISMKYELDEIYSFKLWEIEVSKNNPLHIIVELSKAEIEITFGTSVIGDYAFEVTHFSADGQRTFLNRKIEFGSSDLHTINFNRFSENNSVSLTIDHGSDGSIEETKTLINQAQFFFLPLLFR